MKTGYVKNVFFIALILASTIAQAKNYTIGLSVWSNYPNSVRGFKAALRQAGLVEGENVDYVLRNAKGDKQAQQSIAKEFKNLELDLVYSLTTLGTTIIKNTLDPDTPIVFSIVTYPADSGLIDSFEYSGNNLVGTSNFVPYSQYISILRSVLPNAKTVAIFHRKGEPNSRIQAVSMRRLFRRKKMEATIYEVENTEEVTAVAKDIATSVDVFMSTTDTLMQSGGEDALIEISLASKVPILSSNKAGIESGALFGPVVDFYTLGTLSGEMAVKILKGQSTPSRLESKLQEPPIYLINRATMKQLGLSILEELDNTQFVD